MMKNKIRYMVGALISSAILAFGCSEDLPTYSGLSVDKSDLFIKIEKPTAEINIVEGNGNYKIEVADESIATAKIEGDKIIFTAVKNGRTTATITDWSRHSTVINIRVKEDFNLELDKDKLTLINLEGRNTEQIYIKSGNDEYKVESSDESIVMAELNTDGTIQVTYVSGGFADVTVTDADGKEVVIKVASCDYDLTFADIPLAWKTGVEKNLEIATGNGGYEVISDNEEVVTAEIVVNEENPERYSIKITGVSMGDANITITDRMGLSYTIAVTVRDGLKIETASIDYLEIGTAQTINIIDGSGDYSWTNSNSATTCNLSEDKNQLIVNGAQSALNQTITFTDNTFNETLTITVRMIDYAFETAKARWYLGGAFGAPEACSIKESNGVQILRCGVWYKPFWGDGYVRNGYVIHFKERAVLGEKPDAKLYKQPNNSNSDTGSEIKVSNVRLEKTQLNEENKGLFWFKFREEGRDEDSYIVAHT